MPFQGVNTGKWPIHRALPCVISFLPCRQNIDLYLFECRLIRQFPNSSIPQFPNLLQRVKMTKQCVKLTEFTDTKEKNA